MRKVQTFEPTYLCCLLGQNWLKSLELENILRCDPLFRYRSKSVSQLPNRRHVGVSTHTASDVGWAKVGSLSRFNLFSAEDKKMTSWPSEDFRRRRNFYSISVWPSWAVRGSCCSAVVVRAPFKQMVGSSNPVGCCAFFSSLFNLSVIRPSTGDSWRCNITDIYINMNYKANQT